MTGAGDIARLVGVAGQACERATGRLLPTPDFDKWPLTVDDEDSFRHLVSSGYVWLHELWSPHANFFKTSGAPALGLTTAALRVADGDINTLRTSQQHRLDPTIPRDARTLRDVARWMQAACGSNAPRSSEEWRACGEALLGEMEAAVREFIGIARAVENDGDLSARWQQCFGAGDVDLVAVRQEIAGDLGLVLQAGDGDYVDRRIKGAWERAFSRSSPKDLLSVARSIVLRELMAWSTPDLPCDIEEILTRLEVDAGRDGLAAVRLVQAISEIVEFDGVDDLLDVASEAWHQLTEAD